MNHPISSPNPRLASLCAALFCTVATAQTMQTPQAVPPASETAVQAAAPTPAAAPLAYFEGQPQNGKRYRWLAQTFNTHGFQNKDCAKNTITLPVVSFEDAGVPRYKTGSDRSETSPYPKTANDPKRLAAAGGDQRLMFLRHGFPKLKGKVYGFDAKGQRTGELELNADLLNIATHGGDGNACEQDAKAKDGESVRLRHYAKAVQTLFSKGAFSPVTPEQRDRLNQTVVFTNDPNDAPHLPQVQAAPEDVKAKLNARLKAKLARDLEVMRKNSQVHLALFDTPDGLAQYKNRSNLPVENTAEYRKELARRKESAQIALASLPANIDAVFLPCPAVQFALDAKASRMLYLLRCGGDYRDPDLKKGMLGYIPPYDPVLGDDSAHAMGFYEQTSAGELVLVKVKVKVKDQQTDSGTFKNGMANFPLSSWLDHYTKNWLGRWTESGDYYGLLKKERPIDQRPNDHPYPQLYQKGLLRPSATSEPYIRFLGVRDLQANRSAPAAQVYLAVSGHHESPFSTTVFVPGAKPGDPWTLDMQRFPEPMFE